MNVLKVIRIAVSLLSLTVLGMAACQVAPRQALLPTVDATISRPTLTIDPPATTAAPPPATVAAPNTLTPWPTETPTPAPSLTHTATSVPLSLVVAQNAICRTGPASTYPVRAYFSTGQMLLPTGWISDHSWFEVQTDPVSTACWIYADLVTSSGNLASLPIRTPPPTATLQLSPTSPVYGLKVFMYSLGTGGGLGCGDDMFFIFSGESASGGVEAHVIAALNALFRYKTEYVSGFYNPGFRSNLHAERAEFDPASGVIHVWLSGYLFEPDDKCEAKRVEEQMTMTAQQFPEVRRAVLWSGDQLVGDLLYIP